MLSKATPWTLKQQTLHNCEITWTAPVPKPQSVEEYRKDFIAAETTPLPITIGYTLGSVGHPTNTPHNKHIYV